MSFIDPRTKQINCKIAYYGPVAAGKTTTLRHIYEKTSPSKRGEILTLAKDGDRTLFFDFLPLSLGKVKDYTVRFHLYTVPGQVVYDSARTIILKGMDAVVFVVDSQIDRLEDTLESWKNLKKSLKGNDLDFRTIPIAIQYNKRDLSNTLPVEEIRSLFNDRDFPAFETIATQGKQIMECFQTIAKSVLKNLKTL